MKNSYQNDLRGDWTTMKQRTVSFVLTLALLLGSLPAASAVSITDSDVFLTQQTNYTCTLVSSVMMLRRKAILDGDAGWSAITEPAVRARAWSGAGLLWNFTYNGLSVTTHHLDSNGIRGLDAKRAYLLDLLAQHPEGIVIYNHDRPHAVLLTDYDADTDAFYCADPSRGSTPGRIPLSQATIPGGGQEGKLSGIHQVWYISSGVSAGAGTMELPAPAEETTLLSEALEIPPEEASFADVPDGEWFADAVRWAVLQGVASGTEDGSFSPDASCSIGEALTFLWRASGQPEPAAANPFSDVSESDFYYKPALWAYETGLASGGELQPDAPCTRLLMVTYLWQASGMPRHEAAFRFCDLSPWLDCAPAVSWAVDMNIAAGTGDGSTFSPDEVCSRAQVVTFLYRALAGSEPAEI